MGKIQGTDLELLGVSSINDTPIDQLGGSGDGSNYLTTGKTGNTIADVNIWQGYENTVNGVNPDRASGGTSLLAVSLNPTNPISGTGDIRFTKPASNIYGDGRALPFSIENRHLARVIQITVDARLESGTYATGDLRLSIIQDPSGTPVCIEPVNTSIQLGIAGQTVKLIATFQTHITIKSYALCVHVSSPSSLAYTVDFNNFKVWEPVANYGAIITDWTQHILTSSNTQGIGTPYASPSQNVRWRRVGSNLEMRGNFRIGTTTASEFRINFPGGLTANITPITDRNDAEVIGYLAIDGSSQTANRTLHTKNGFGYFNLGTQRSDTTANPLSANNGDSISSDQDITFHLSVPIQGWGSNMALSSDAGDGRVVACRYTVWVTQALTGGVTRLRFSNITYDTHGSYTPSTGIFVAPVSGTYRYSFTGRFDFTAQIYQYVDNAFNEALIDCTTNFNQTVTGAIFLRSGQQLDFRTSGSGNAISTGGGASAISIERIGTGSQIIAPVENIQVTGVNNSGLVVNHDTWTNVTGWTKETDSHGTFTPNGLFTAQVSGIYSFDVVITYTATTNARIGLSKNGDSNRVRVSSYDNSGAFGTGIGASVYLLSGETIRIQTYHSSGSSRTLELSNYCSIAITREGI
jgi:hypothetical protein